MPLVIGGGSRRILELAARRADIVSLHRNLEGGVAASWVDEKRPRDRPGLASRVARQPSVLDRTIHEGTPPKARRL